MKTALIELFGIASMVTIIMQTFPLYAKFVQWTGQMKPFSCELCMCFWTHLIFVSIRHGLTIDGLLSSFVCAIIGYIITLKFVKWLE